MMSKGVCDAPNTIQSLMNRVINDYADLVLVIYMDDRFILIRDEESHFKHPEIVLFRP